MKTEGIANKACFYRVVIKRNEKCDKFQFILERPNNEPATVTIISTLASGKVRMRKIL